MHCVLVVDDDPGIRRLAHLALTSAGFLVFDAENGSAALPILAREHPDVIVLDMSMPVMDGRALFHNMEAAGNRPAVLIVTANDAAGTKRELGAEASLEKPFDPEDLVDAVMGLAS
jgi:DNA-binding response OmpR family regulator